MKAHATVPSDASAIEVSLLLRATLCLCWPTTRLMTMAGVSVRSISQPQRGASRPTARRNSAKVTRTNRLKATPIGMRESGAITTPNNGG